MFVCITGTRVIRNVNTMKRKNKKHIRHTWEWEEGCPKCEYQEAYCKHKKCSKMASRDSQRTKIEIW